MGLLDPWTLPGRPSDCSSPEDVKKKYSIDHSLSYRQWKAASREETVKDLMEELIFPFESQLLLRWWSQLSTMCQPCWRGTTMLCSDGSVSFLPVFKEKPKHPPSRAQSLSYALASTDASYLSSIVRLFKNLNFVLLVITYGKVPMCPGVYLHWQREAIRPMCPCATLFPNPKCACKLFRLH